MQLLVELLLKKNGIPFDKSELEFQIQSHPSYPSLYSITGVLDHFKITNVAARIPETQDALNELPPFFLAQVGQQESSTLCLVEMLDDQCKLTSPTGHSSIIALDKFLASFTGIVLAVEKSDHETQTVSSSSHLPKIVLALISISILFVFFNSVTGILTPLIFLTAIAGVLISVAILQQESGVKNVIGEAFCSTDSNKNDCNTVLSSEGARLTGDYKLSDLCLVYFVGLSLSVFLLVIQDLSLMPVYVLALLGLPVTFYSIYYQAVKLKSWCFLCLSIVGILWVQAGLILGFFSLSFSGYPGPAGFFSIGIGFISSLAIWSYLKPMYQEAKENRRYKIGYYKFKKDSRIFSRLLREQPVIKTNIANIDEIVFGNRESNLEVLVVTNPFCRHCRDVHALIEEILKKHSHQVRITIRFNIKLTSAMSDVVTIAANLLHIHAMEGQAKSLRAMHEAFHGRSPKDWIDKWSGSENINVQYFQSLEVQKTWCTAHKINFTPEVLINGYPFPAEYERNDLLFFIADLYEEYNTEKHIDEAIAQ